MTNTITIAISSIIDLSDMEQLEEDEYGDDEEWTLNEEPTEESSNGSDEENKDESVDQMSNKTWAKAEGPTTRSKQSVSKSEEKVHFEPLAVEFENVLRKPQKTVVTGHHTCISNSFLLMKCF